MQETKEKYRDAGVTWHTGSSTADSGCHDFQIEQEVPNTGVTGNDREFRRGKHTGCCRNHNG